MACRWNLLVLVLCLSLGTVLSKRCPPGFTSEGQICIDTDECDEFNYIGQCGDNARCLNTVGSYFCQCVDGFRSTKGNVNFSAETSEKCKDINECDDSTICGPNAKCSNQIPHYYCTCESGFISGVEKFQNSDNVTCGDICKIDKTICGNGTCHRGATGHYCACHAGFTNYGNKESRCTELKCDEFKDMNILSTFPIAHDLLMQLKKTCLELTNNETSTFDFVGEDILERLLSVIDKYLSSGAFNDNRKVSTFLDLVENALRLTGAFIKTPKTNKSFKYTELEMLVRKGSDIPKGAVNLSSKHAQVDMQWETAAGDPSLYPGFAAVSLLTYRTLEEFANGFFSGMKPQENESFKLNSKVVTVTVSNRNTSRLEKPVQLNFKHLEELNKNHTCVFWNSSEHGGSWSAEGCSVVESNLTHTVCSCNHLSSFAVLMALYDIEEQYKFQLQLITWVGLSLSLVCLFICILTFWLIRSIQSPRTTIHLHLCITLFIATLIFLAGISRTENKVGCAVVAGLLHFFYLAAFCWMCLEGIQLFRMVVLVFNANLKTRYMMAGGYGVPALIVAISALANAKGYGTKEYCWLNLDSIWGFFAPACIIIFINIFFFLITVWKLAQKFSSLNPDLDNLQKIKTFTITAVAQLCVLGTMWIFGSFQFSKGTIAMSYLFTIFGSIQGIMLFVMHCLFSKQVREEYGNILSRCCAPRKSYSEFSYNSKAHASKSSQDTGESHI
ncbi:putative adhesion G protein-coupled receptor E4P isoform X2 [Thunnus maccoyii]|uniref:putative adhesion G protein-coupled receptor E4P isoform X2 n=1 Tax=Thunnus maccoyii TaxID=8240 RepID=UPI001C4CF2DE|nr:putative adhesion G protein-coupled receptor E4P isoform X2 [Thunnus maccoyii]